MELKVRNKAAFGFGAFGKDVVYMLVTTYLLYYYHEILGMSSTFVGAVLMAARVFDAVNDPFMGIVVAKTKTRWGRFRPWILTGTVLNAFTIYALFAVPKNMAMGNMKVWLAVFYILWGISYTLMDIPFWSMVPAITKPGKDREQLSSLARSCSGIGDAVPTVLTMVIVPVLSGSSAVANYDIGFRWWALIIAIVFVISEVVFCLNVPEKVPEKTEVTTIGQMFRSLFKNDQALVVVGAIICVYMALDIVGNLLLYFFQTDVGNGDLYSVFVGICFAVQVVTMMLVPVIRKRVGKFSLFRVGLLAQAAGFLLLLVIAYTGVYKNTTWMLLCIPGIVVYVGYGILNVMLTIFLSDSVDYGEVKNGTREESVIFSMQTFTVKLAAGVAVFISGLGLDLIKFNTDKLPNGDVVKQTAGTLKGLRFLMTIPPVIFLIAAFIIFVKFYKLDDKKMKEVTDTLADKKSGVANE